MRKTVNKTDGKYTRDKYQNSKASVKSSSSHDITLTNEYVNNYTGFRLQGNPATE